MDTIGCDNSFGWSNHSNLAVLWREPHRQVLDLSIVHIVLLLLLVRIVGG